MEDDPQLELRMINKKSKHRNRPRGRRPKNSAKTLMELQDDKLREEQRLQYNALSTDKRLCPKNLKEKYQFQSQADQ